MTATIDDYLNEIRHIIDEYEKNDKLDIADDLRTHTDLFKIYLSDTDSMTRYKKQQEFDVIMKKYNSLVKDKLIDNKTDKQTITDEHESLDILTQAHQQLVETEEVGKNVLSNLGKQTQQIKKMKNDMEDIQDEVIVGNKLINKMTKRASWLYCVIS